MALQCQIQNVQQMKYNIQRKCSPLWENVIDFVSITVYSSWRCGKHHNQYSFTVVVISMINISGGTENVCRKSTTLISQEYMSSPGPSHAALTII